MSSVGIWGRPGAFLVRGGVMERWQHLWCWTIERRFRCHFVDLRMDEETLFVNAEGIALQMVRVLLQVLDIFSHAK
jgi:hypothetical protein